MMKPENLINHSQYFAVIFTTTLRSDIDHKLYEEWTDRISEIVTQQPGYLGVDYARQDVGITISYWKDEESIKLWRKHPDHRKAMEHGVNHFYQSYALHVARVERNHYFEANKN